MNFLAVPYLFSPEVLSVLSVFLLIADSPLLAAGTIVGNSYIVRSCELLELTSDDAVVIIARQEAILRIRDIKAGAEAGVHDSVVVTDRTTVIALLFLS